MTGILYLLRVLTISFSNNNIPNTHSVQPLTPVPFKYTLPYILYCAVHCHTCLLYQTLLSVQYRSYSTVYMVTICSASTGEYYLLNCISLTSRFYELCVRSDTV